MTLRGVQLLHPTCGQHSSCTELRATPPVLPQVKPAGGVSMHRFWSLLLGAKLLGDPQQVLQGFTAEAIEVLTGKALGAQVVWSLFDKGAELLREPEQEFSSALVVIQAALEDHPFNCKQRRNPLSSAVNSDADRVRENLHGLLTEVSAPPGAPVLVTGLPLLELILLRRSAIA